MKTKKLNKIISNFHIIVQARLGSKRLPFKILKKIDHRSVLDFLIENLLTIFKSKKIILATTTNKEDKKLNYVKKKYGINIFYGSEKNVLQRYIGAAKKFNARRIIRLTSDCPLVDLNLIKRMSSIFNKSKYDYISNNCILSKRRYPDGMDVEIFKYESLKKSVEKTINLDLSNIFVGESMKDKKIKIGDEQVIVNVPNIIMIEVSSNEEFNNITILLNREKVMDEILK